LSYDKRIYGKTSEEVDGFLFYRITKMCRRMTYIFDYNLIVKIAYRKM